MCSESLESRSNYTCSQTVSEWKEAKKKFSIKIARMSVNDLKIILEFSAGAELLFGNIKRREVILDGKQKWSIRELLKWMHANILTERPELFIQGETVRPGILVLINDTDWELLGELDYELQLNDNVLFISTLHGG